MNTLTASSFGMLVPLSENSWTLGNTTTGTGFTEGSEAQYPIRSRRIRIKTLLAWTIIGGNPTVAACTSYPSLLDYEFAIHRYEIGGSSITL